MKKDDLNIKNTKMEKYSKIMKKKRNLMLNFEISLKKWKKVRHFEPFRQKHKNFRTKNQNFQREIS